LAWESNLLVESEQDSAMSITPISEKGSSVLFTVSKEIVGQVSVIFRYTQSVEG
jgi:hypothetical protein